MAGMDVVFNDFKNGYQNRSGYILANSLSPFAPPGNPNKLRTFQQSTNYQNVQQDFSYTLIYDKSSPVELGQDEGKAWVEIYVAYWKAVDAILKAEQTKKNGYTVSYHHQSCFLSRIFARPFILERINHYYDNSLPSLPWWFRSLWISLSTHFITHHVQSNIYSNMLYRHRGPGCMRLGKKWPIFSSEGIPIATSSPGRYLVYMWRGNTWECLLSRPTKNPATHLI